MLVNCSHCQASLDVAPEHYGQIVSCPACNGKLQIAATDESAPKSTSSSKPRREGWAEKDHANADFLKSFLFALLATLVFLLCMVPFQQTRVGAVFLERGWVNYAETFLFFWGLSILVLKHLKNKHQEKAALMHLFPESLGEEVNSQTVGGFIDNIYKLPAKLRDSIIVNRIRKSLELFETRNSNNEVSVFLATQSDLDANRSTGSYTLVKVFLWAIPILGFIGTVMGLSEAVGSLGGDNSDPEALKESINNLTGGLGIAFDTTLLGLILSILLSFPLAAVQKKEDETLTFIDTFCTEKLLPKLNDSKNSSDDILLKNADSLPELVGSLSRAHETFLDNLNASTRQLKDTSDAVNTSIKDMEVSFTKAVEKLSETTSKIYLRSDNELDESFKKIATGIDLMNVSLAKLGEKKIPNKKKGFFGGS
ncbi:MAG: MotA/TolQ/ExbB proton channel family protein [Akkermansiaceae bacterium]